jgi:ATP-dependent helicase Lhr and Lhr-like helicase
MSALLDFHPLVRTWFTRAYGEPSPPQELGWPHISAGENTLILAPTGSGKTLAAFLWAINHLVEQKLEGPIEPGVRILYVSPLKALNNDIERNLEAPLRGIAEGAREHGVQLPNISVAVRTGDTPQSKRAAMLRRPPEILITTPESLYLMLTSPRAREMFRTVHYCIVDEIHSLCSNKRGVHLSLTLERLQLVAEQEFVRIGLSATQRPLERIAAFLGGLEDRGQGREPRPVTIVDAGRRKETDLRVSCPVPDFSLLPQGSVWPTIFDHLLELIRTHRTTLVFVNNRRLAERVASTLNEMTGSPDAPLATNLYGVPRGGSGAAGRWAGRKAGGEDQRRDADGWRERKAGDEGRQADADRWAGPQTGAFRQSDGDGGEREAGEPDHQEPLLVQAYHGSMSREARETMEADLKAGKLRALIATSSLELGIDIGSINLVVQLQSPKGVARGLQRVGRSGHLITATSKGRILPTHREDLVESAVIAAAMLRHDVEETSIPENPLDVLAQQIVAMVSVQEWDIDSLYDVVCRSYCYRSLPRQLFSGVVQMLAGRYGGDAFGGLQARVSWDRVNNLLRSLPGSGRLAITGGGTISDRGYYGVYLGDGKTRVGEVDEEFVYETRVGDTFLLGTSVWRVTGIDANRVSVDPAPGQPARMPFWRGEGIGRSVELGRQVGAFRRELADRLDDPGVLAWLEQEFPIDSAAAWNILEYFRRQRSVTAAIPHDQRFLVEGFRDEIGDPRIVVHTSLGRRINTLFGFVLGRRLHARTGVEPQVFTNDDGILLRCPDVTDLPLDLFEGLTPAEAELVVTEELLSSPLFGGQFRQNAVRALIMTKPSPGRRTPLWLQRLRAGDLLQVVRQYDDFPIVIETIREALDDVLDFRAFREVTSRIASGAIEIATTQTEVPSPFTASLLFDFMAVYMYEWDQPKADTLSRFVSINRELLAEVVDLESVRSMIRPEAVALVESQLQHREPGYRARSPEELMELLVRLGDLDDDEIRERCEGDGSEMVRALERDGRAVRKRVGSDHRWIAGEDRALYGDLSVERSTNTIVRRFLQHRGPVTASQIVRRYNIPADVVARLATGMIADGALVSGRLVDLGEEERQYCFRPTLERIHRQTLTILRKEITPSTIDAYARFLMHWQGISAAAGHTGPRRGDPLPAGAGPATAGQVASGQPGLDRMASVQATPEILAQHLEQLQGLALPVEVWPRDVLPARCGSVTPAVLDQLTAGGLFVWAGAGSGRIRPLLRGGGALFLGGDGEKPIAGAAGASNLSDRARRVLEYLDTHGASFFGDMRKALTLSLHALNNALAELFWSGLITNDVFSEILRVRRVVRENDEVPDERLEVTRPRSTLRSSPELAAARRAIRQVPGWSGRWSLLRTPSVLGEERSATEIAREQAGQLLRRYGIVAREVHRKETMLSWPVIAADLQRLEMRGDIRRGYFLEGFSGMQFALPGAVEKIRSVREAEGGSIVVLNSCDPASPYGIVERERQASGEPAEGREEGRHQNESQQQEQQVEDGSPEVRHRGQEEDNEEQQDGRHRRAWGSGPTTVQRAPSTFIVLRDGVLVMVMENYGKRVRTSGDAGSTDLEAVRRGIGYLKRLLDLPDPLSPAREIVIELWNGERASASAAAGILREEKFRGGPGQSMVYDGY